MDPSRPPPSLITSDPLIKYDNILKVCIPKTNTMCLSYIWGLQKNDTVYSVGLDYVLVLGMFIYLSIYILHLLGEPHYSLEPQP